MRPLTALLPALLAAAAAPAADDAWTQESGEAELLYQDGGNTIRDETATKDVTPRLEFSCTGDDPSPIARIDWQRFISSFSTEVGFKVDGGSFTWLKWRVDGSEKVTYSPSPEDTRRLIATLAGGGELLVDVTPYSEGPVTVTFDLAGFTEALETLEARCR
jgi:hypothetical protein